MAKISQHIVYLSKRFILYIAREKGIPNFILFKKKPRWERERERVVLYNLPPLNIWKIDSYCRYPCSMQWKTWCLTTSVSTSNVVSTWRVRWYAPCRQGPSYSTYNLLQKIRTWWETKNLLEHHGHTTALIKEPSTYIILKFPAWFFSL